MPRLDLQGTNALDLEPTLCSYFKLNYWCTGSLILVHSRFMVFRFYIWSWKTYKYNRSDNNQDIQSQESNTSSGLALSWGPLIDISIARVYPSHFEIQLNFVLSYLQVIILARILSPWRDLDLRLWTSAWLKDILQGHKTVCLLIQNQRWTASWYQILVPQCLDMSRAAFSFTIRMTRRAVWLSVFSYGLFSIFLLVDTLDKILFLLTFLTSDWLAKIVISISGCSEVTFPVSYFPPIR